MKSFSEAIEKVDCDVPEDVNTTHAGWLNLVKNIPQLLQAEHVNKVKRGRYGLKLLMRLLQKISAWINPMLYGLTRPGNWVEDARAGTSSVNRVCMSLSKRKRPTGCGTGLVA